MDLFRTAHGSKGVQKGPPLPKICCTHPTMMKLGTVIPNQKGPRNIWITWHTPWILLTSALFHQKSAFFVISSKYRLHFDTHFNSFNFESLKVVLINMVGISMMSAKLATLGFLKITIFQNKSYDVIISVHDVTDKTLSRESNCFVNVVMWPKFGRSSISMREVIITSILYGFAQKNQFLWRLLLVEVQ